MSLTIRTERNNAALNDIIDAIEPLCVKKEDAFDILSLLLMSLVDISNETEADIYINNYGQVNIRLSQEKNAIRLTEHSKFESVKKIVKAMGPHCKNHNDSFHFAALALIGLIKAADLENNETHLKKCGVVLTWFDENTGKQNKKKNQWV